MSNQYFKYLRGFSKICIFFVMLLLIAEGLSAAPESRLWERWTRYDPLSSQQLDHEPWDRLLKKYILSNPQSAQNHFAYSSVSSQDRVILKRYLEYLSGIEISKLQRLEQKVFWINLYNALTVSVVLEHYPVKSIRDIDISPGWFSNGPWDAKLLKVEALDLSLNDIEHRILRPIWRDNRVHYALNCASLGCPDLQGTAFTADNVERLLDKGAEDFVNHPRGVRVTDRELVLSSIYKWFIADFGGAEEAVLKHLQKYARQPLKNELGAFQGTIGYEYQWSLNE
jgi:Protein of unknown function, DUF547